MDSLHTTYRRTLSASWENTGIRIDGQTENTGKIPNESKTSFYQPDIEASIGCQDHDKVVVAMEMTGLCWQDDWREQPPAGGREAVEGSVLTGDTYCVAKIRNDIKTERVIKIRRLKLICDEKQICNNCYYDLLAK